MRPIASVHEIPTPTMPSAVTLGDGRKSRSSVTSRMVSIPTGRPFEVDGIHDLGPVLGLIRHGDPRPRKVYRVTEISIRSAILRDGHREEIEPFLSCLFHAGTRSASTPLHPEWQALDLTNKAGAMRRPPLCRTWILLAIIPPMSVTVKRLQKIAFLGSACLWCSDLIRRGSNRFDHCIDRGEAISEAKTVPQKGLCEASV